MSFYCLQGCRVICDVLECLALHFVGSNTRDKLCPFFYVLCEVDERGLTKFKLRIAELRLVECFHYIIVAWGRTVLFLGDAQNTSGH
jgi:hypothetical protein